MAEADQEPKKVYPSLTEERKLWRAGFVRVAGLDEAGRGALAGPVVAGAVILPVNSKQEGLWAEVQDSKLLSPARREALAGRIQAQAAAWSLGEASAAEIDASGIAPATRLAMRRAVQALSPPPDHLLIDWVQLKSLNLPQQSFTKGDLRIVSIASASILAKVHRDRLPLPTARRVPRLWLPQPQGLRRALPSRRHRKVRSMPSPSALVFAYAQGSESIRLTLPMLILMETKTCCTGCYPRSPTSRPLSRDKQALGPVWDLH